MENQKESKTSDVCDKKETVYSQEEEVSDPELDDLLDDALLDFSTTKTKLAEDEKENASPSGACAGAAGGAGGNEAMFNKVFDSETQKQLGEMMQAFMDPNMMKNIEKLSEAAGKSGDSEGKKKFEETLKETLGGLTKNAEDLQSDLPEDELLKLLTNMNTGEEDSELGPETDDLNLMPMMQGMMKTLLSKDVLYPSLKDISTKYPEWLKENKNKTRADQLENYNTQFDFMKEICSQFEAEQDSDSDEVKKERFEKVLDLMQKMQELGYPPKELVGDLPPGFLGTGGEGGFSNLLQNADKCSVM